MLTASGRLAGKKAAQVVQDRDEQKKNEVLAPESAFLGFNTNPTTANPSQEWPRLR